MAGNRKTFGMIAGPLGASMGASIGGLANSAQAAESAMPWYANTFDPKNISGLYYQHFLLKNEHCFQYCNEYLLENAASYAVDKKLKQEMYRTLRDNSMLTILWRQ